jgi:hypothetical protein
MSSVNQGSGMIPTAIPTCLLLKGKAMNDANPQRSKISVVDKQHWACQRGPSLQRRQVVLQAIVTQVVVMRVGQSAKAMYSDLMRMLMTMRAMTRIVMTTSLNLKANPGHVCLHSGKRKLAQKGVQQRQRCQVYLGVANGSKQPGNATMAVRAAPSGPNGLFVNSTVGVTNLSKAMGFARLTVAESVVSMQLGVERVLQAQLLIALLTAAEGDVSMQVDVERVPKLQLLIVLLTAAESDVSMQLGVTKQSEAKGFVWLTAGASDVSMQLVATSLPRREGYVNGMGGRLDCGISSCD